MALLSSSMANHKNKEVTMDTLHDMYTICDKEGMMISLVISEALQKLEKATEEGDEMGIMLQNLAIDLYLSEVEPIEE